MGIHCESCGKISADEDAVYWKYCGFRYEKSELDVSKNIHKFLNENQKNSHNSIKMKSK